MVGILHGRGVGYMTMVLEAFWGSFGRRLRWFFCTAIVNLIGTRLVPGYIYTDSLRSGNSTQ